MTLHQLAKSIVDSLWHNSIEELRFDGIDKKRNDPRFGDALLYRLPFLSVQRVVRLRYVTGCPLTGF